MTSALFSIGIVPVTVEMTVRLRAPVKLDRGAVVIGTIGNTSSPPLYSVRAELLPDRKRRGLDSAKPLVRDSV